MKGHKTTAMNESAPAFREAHANRVSRNAAPFIFIQLQHRLKSYVNLLSCFGENMTDPATTLPSLHHAVPETYRNQGRAKEAIRAAIAEMRHGLGQAGRTILYIEAIVGTHDAPSQCVAAQDISSAPAAVIDRIPGLPALQYVRKIVYRKLRSVTQSRQGPADLQEQER